MRGSAIARTNRQYKVLFVSPGAQGMGHPGHVEYVTDGAGVPYQYFHYSPWVESLISQTRTPNSTDFSTPYRFNAKELDSESGLFYYGARYYHPVVSKWLSVDPMAHLRESLSPYNYCSNNPILRIDPDGALDEPVYGSDGTYRGNTKEGFTGQVINYDGDKDFSNMEAFELLYDESFNVGAQRGDANTYDRVRSELSGDAKSKIWTHIVSQMEGQLIYDEIFSMSDLEGGKIHFDGSLKDSWVSSYVLGKGQGKIRGSDKYTYKTTVENIQSSVVVHEWYSHIKKGQGNYEYLKSHRLAYKNVINYKPL